MNVYGAEKVARFLGPELLKVPGRFRPPARKRLWQSGGKRNAAFMMKRKQSRRRNFPGSAI